MPEQRRLEVVVVVSSDCINTAPNKTTEVRASSPQMGFGEENVQETQGCAEIETGRQKHTRACIGEKSEAGKII